MFPIPRLLVLVGPVASGKSSYSKNCAKYGWVVVNDDSIVSALHAGDYQRYDKFLTPLYKTVETQATLTGLALGRSVVVDRGTNNRPDSRRRWVGLAHSLDVPAVAVVFPNEGAEVHARRRAESDGRGHPYEYWKMVADHHASEAQPVTASEGFDDIVTVDWPFIQSGGTYP